MTTLTQDDIRKLAKAAGLIIDGNNSGDDDLFAFAALVAAAEREACAKVCEEIMQEHNPFDRQAGVARSCLDDIRARSQA
jgi:hypothetical protein